jgi:hypothetical protein
VIQIFSSGRQTGKTHHLVEWARERPDRTIITADEREAERLRRTYDLTVEQVVSAQSWSRGHQRYSSNPRELAVDNLDLWLYTQFGNVTQVTMTEPAAMGSFAHVRPIPPPGPDDYECCASGSCEVCRPGRV